VPSVFVVAAVTSLAGYRCSLAKPDMVLGSGIVVPRVIVFSGPRNMGLWMLAVASFRGNAGPGSGVRLMVFHVMLNCPCMCVAYHG